MDPSVTDLVHKMTELSVLVAGLQANVEWLTKLVWAMIILNAASFLTNSYLGVRNGRSRK